MKSGNRLCPPHAAEWLRPLFHPWFELRRLSHQLWTDERESTQGCKGLAQVGMGATPSASNCVGNPANGLTNPCSKSASVVHAQGQGLTPDFIDPVHERRPVDAAGCLPLQVLVEEERRRTNVISRVLLRRICRVCHIELLTKPSAGVGKPRFKEPKTPTMSYWLSRWRDIAEPRTAASLLRAAHFHHWPFTLSAEH